MERSFPTVLLSFLQPERTSSSFVWPECGLLIHAHACRLVSSKPCKSEQQGFTANLGSMPHRGPAFTSKILSVFKTNNSASEPCLSGDIAVSAKDRLLL